MVERHEHNGTDSPKLNPRDFKGFPIYTSTPTNKAEEGTIVVSENSLYCMIDGTWENISTKAFTGQGSRTSAAGTGTQEITVGFKPQSITIYAIGTAVNDGNSTGVAHDIHSLANNRETHQYWDGTYWRNTYGQDYIINVFSASTAGQSAATVSAISDTSFTLNWAVVDLNVYYTYSVIG